MLIELKESCVNVRFTGKEIVQIGYPMDGNCKGFETKKIKKNKLKAIYDKNEVMCLLIVFTPGVLVTKAPKILWIIRF